MYKRQVRKLLDQLFEFARIEADELVLAEEAVNLGNVLRDTLALFYNDFCSQDSEPEIQIPDDPFVVTGDTDAFKRIFSNILSNALTHGEGHFSIKAVLTDGAVNITFENRTHSITPDDLPCIFDRFYTTDVSRSRKTTGLGLSIAKRLATLSLLHIFLFCHPKRLSSHRLSLSPDFSIQKKENFSFSIT